MWGVFLGMPVEMRAGDKMHWDKPGCASPRAVRRVSDHFSAVTFSSHLNNSERNLVPGGNLIDFLQ